MFFSNGFHKYQTKIGNNFYKLYLNFLNIEIIISMKNYRGET